MILNRLFNKGSIFASDCLFPRYAVAAAAPSSSASFFRSSSSASQRQHAAPASFVEEENVASSRDGPGLYYGLHAALAGKGVIVKENAFRNLTPSELRQKGASIAEPVQGFALFTRGTHFERSSEISKAQFSRLLKQVTTHMSSLSDIFVHDGSIGSSSSFDVKVRVISDSPSAVCTFYSSLGRISARAISHDPCPLTVYVASSISSSAGDALGLRIEGNNGLIAADTERSSLVVCGKAFADVNGIKETLAALAEPIISLRGGLLLPARLLVCCDSVVLLFAPEDTVNCYSNFLLSADAGVVLSPHCVSPLFRNANTGGLHLPDGQKLPASVILVSYDSSGAIPSVSKLSPGQAAYHFLAGYQDGKFIPGYTIGLSFLDPLEIAKAFLCKLKDYEISSFLVNAYGGEKQITDGDFVKLMLSTLQKDIPPIGPRGGDLRRKYKRYLTGKFGKLPEEFSF